MANTPHVHAKLIKAWADGAEIEYWDDWSGKWMQSASPNWVPKTKYRIKPTPKPDVVRWACISNLVCLNAYLEAQPRPKENVQLIFDGETGELKSAKVIVSD